MSGYRWVMYQYRLRYYNPADSALPLVEIAEVWPSGLGQQFIAYFYPNGWASDPDDSMRRPNLTRAIELAESLV